MGSLLWTREMTLKAEHILLILALTACIGLSITVITLRQQLNLARGDAEMGQEVLIHTCLGETYACEAILHHKGER